VALGRKFGEDRAGNRAALIAYYGFFALFPLLLGLSAAAGWILHGNEDLQRRLTDSALAQFPIIGAQIKGNLGSFDGSWVAVVLGFGAAAWGGVRVLNVTRAAMDTVWHEPGRPRVGFMHRAVRDLLTVLTFGAFVVAGAVVGAAAGALTGTIPGFMVGLVMSSLLDALIFAIVFRLLTTADLSWRTVMPGALVAGVSWALLQNAGGYLLAHRIEQSQRLYGFFAIVIGLLTWIHLGALLTMIGAEINTVRARRRAGGV
jgi:YihY family inner membrane protein